MAQTLIPPFYQVDRGGFAGPGDYNPDEAQPGVPAAGEPKRKYIRVPDGSGGWTYYVVAEGTSVDPARVTASGGEVVDLPAAWNIQDGYHEAASGAPQPPPAQNPSPAPPPSASPAAPAAAPPAPQPGAPTNVPGTLNNVPGQFGSANDIQPQDLRGKQWVYIRRPEYNGAASDVVSYGTDPNDTKSTVVPVDSPLARAQLADPTARANVFSLDTNYIIRGDPTQINPNLLLSNNFQQAAKRYGANIVGYSEGGPPQLEGADQNAKSYDVTWELADGTKLKYTFAKFTDGANGSTYWRTTGAPVMNTDGVKDPESKASTINLQTAQAEAQRAQAAYQRGQIPEQEAKAAEARALQAEKEWNSQHNYGYVTHEEAAKGALTRAQVVQAGTQAENTAQNTASTAQGTINQTYQNVLQYYRDITNDEATAQRLTMEYFNNKANVDAGNNRLALDAAKSEVDANTAANTQRVSLANNRLSQAGQGMTDDFRAASDLNQYLKPGSTKGADAFLAMQALRYATAKKYGAFDVNDVDLRYDESKLPNGIRAFANPSAPSFATYPNLDDMRNEAYNTSDRWGAHNRPAPPGTGEIVKPKTVPSIDATLPPGQPRPGTAGPQTPKPTSAPQAAAPKPNNLGNGEAMDDIITLQGPDGGVTRVSRGGYYYGLQHGQYGGYQVANAEPGSAYAVIDGEYVKKPSPTVSPRPDQTQVGSQIDDTISPPAAAPAPTSAPAGNERPDDILTIYDPREDKTVQVDRATWEDQVRKFPVFADPGRGLQIQNAEPGALYTRNPDGTYTRNGDTFNGPAAPSGYGTPPAGSGESPDVPQTATTGNVSRVQGPTGSGYVQPAALADLTGPSAGLQYTAQILGNQGGQADPEEVRRKRLQQQIMGMSSPNAIYGLFDGAYDQYPTFF
jgi:hypothetical protein